MVLQLNYVGLKRKEEWRHLFQQDKEDLIASIYSQIIEEFGGAGGNRTHA